MHSTLPLIKSYFSIQMIKIDRRRYFPFSNFCTEWPRNERWTIASFLFPIFSGLDKKFAHFEPICFGQLRSMHRQCSTISSYHLSNFFGTEHISAQHFLQQKSNRMFAISNSFRWLSWNSRTLQMTTTNFLTNQKLPLVQSGWFVAS